jgi:hypothetical protein
MSTVYKIPTVYCAYTEVFRSLLARMVHEASATSADTRL